MPIIAERTREEKPGRTARGYYTTEVWEVLSVNADLVTYNQSGVVDPRAAVAHPQLPAYGAAHATLPGAVVVQKQVVQVVANRSVLVAVIYRGWGLYTGGPRRATDIAGDAQETVIPVFHSYTEPGPPALTHYRYTENFVWQRHRSTRVEVRILSGNEIQAVQQALARNVGGWYQLDGQGGDFYILSGKSRASYDGLACTRVEYRFESWAAFPGVAANDPVLRNAVPIPPLSNLETWVAHTDATTFAPVIKVMPKDKFASQGAPLPGM